MDFEARELKPYKGYGLDKAYHIDENGRKKGNYFYLVSNGFDYVGEEYPTLEDAKKAIDDWTR